MKVSGHVMRIKKCSKKSIQPINLVARVVISALAITPLWLNAAEAETQSQNNESEIEILTVTAQKRVQNILKVPVTVGTVTEDTIEESGSILLSNIMLNNGYDTIDEAKALMLIEFKQGNPDILRVGVSRDSCIINRHRYVTVGVDSWKECAFTNTNAIESYILDEPVGPRAIDPSERGKVVYMGICTGCHTYSGRMIGTPVQIIQALYMGNPQGIADFIAAPTKKREDYPKMPPQDYLDAKTRLAAAKYMLGRKN